MTHSLCIDSRRSALLVMDMQNVVMENYAPHAAAVLERTAKLIEAARAAAMKVIYIVVSFRPGYPEIHPRNHLFSALKQSGNFAAGSDTVKIHARVAPRQDDPVIVKHRISAFTATDLDMVLRANDIDTLVLTGVATSGVVLSTARQGFDLDYRLIVARDCCDDLDGDLHATLLNKVIAQHATVVDSGAIADTLRAADRAPLRRGPLDGVRALLFDVFGTVVDWRSGVARDAAAFLARHGRGAVAPTDFADAWRRRYQPGMDEIRSGRRPFTRLDVLHRENLAAELAAIGIDPARVPAAELDELNRAWHRLDPWPDSVPGLTRLKTRYVIAPLSNGNIVLMLDIAKRAGLPWDAILGAEVVQAYKPTPPAYLRTADLLAMRPDEVCLVAAHNSDLAAARKCGLKTAFVARPTEHGSGQTTDLQPEQVWDVVARDLIELAQLTGV